MNQKPEPAFEPEVGLSVEQIAAVCHEANRAYCQQLDDNSQPAWEHAPDWQRNSAIAGVRFHLANPNASPSASHDSWLIQKVKDGWTFGPFKDPVKKEHPCMLPYAQLPVAQRRKDSLFKAVVAALRTP